MLVYYGQTAGWINIPLGMEVGLGPGNIVLDGDPAPPPCQKKGTTPFLQFFAHVYCGQTAGWINMPLGMEVSLGPGHIVLDGDPAPLIRGTAPQFRPVSVVAKQSPVSATAEHLCSLTTQLSVMEISKCRDWLKDSAKEAE